MRSFSLFTIILLCLALLIVDVLAFTWLQSITKLIDFPLLQKTIHILFWVFTAGLILSIITLKITLDDINPKRKHLLITSFYGLAVSSFIPKVIFIIVISILYFTNYVFSEEESVFLVPLIGLLSGILPFLVIVYAIFKAVYRFKVYHVNLEIENLPDALQKLNLIHISDLHLGSFNFKYHILDRAIKLINDANPDFIFFTGDIVNNYAWELKGWEHVFTKLVAKKGKYAILGNHDYGDYSTWKSKAEKEQNFKAIKDFFNTIDFTLLMNESDVVLIENEQLAIIGVENWGKPPFKQYGDLQKAQENLGKSDFKILLSHDPSHWDEEVVEKTDINLTLSGHTHGMQAALTYKNKQWSPIKYKYKRWAGLYAQNNQFLYVNRGLGWLGFPGRVGMRPEITHIKLHKTIKKLKI
ncbi:MAG: metallophosphoesterase [Flavobacteriaceae bacterium]